MVKSKHCRSREQKDRERQRTEEEIDVLNRRVIDEAPARGCIPPIQQRVAFRALPISQATLMGLEGGKTPFTTMTDIQNACIPHALAGRDILGAAKTGSGKTLSFVIPVLELLFRCRYTPEDGPGAIVLSPTRELAMQIFQVVKIAGTHHSFVVGLLIGGRKDFQAEQHRVGTANILIASPGRLLQHLEQTPYFDVSSLKMLVLDEADRILDMGFRDQLLRILDYLPSERQTLLFSATQTRDVSHLATLSLQQPEYLGVHDKEKTATPESLQQSYVVVPLEHKLNAVYSFIKSHLKSKSIIFMSSCAQIRHAWELFCSLRPGIPILALHGKIVQEKRTHIYFDFLQRPHAVLFASDVCARGLDFPNVDWVLQVDAPEDRDMYIHRAGRTARYRAGGKSLLLLTPHEERRGFVQLLQGGTNSSSSSTTTSLPIKKLSINPNKTAVVTQRAASLVASNLKLNELAKKAYKSYVRSIHLMPNKDIFDVKDIPTDEFSKSLGLASTPNLGFLKAIRDRDDARTKKNVNHKLHRLKEQIKAEKLSKKLQRMGKGKEEVEQAIKKSSRQTAHASDDGNDDDDENDDEDILVSRSTQHWRETNDDDPELLPHAHLNEVTKPRKSKKIRIEGSSLPNKRITFNDEGEEESADAIWKTSEVSQQQLELEQTELKQATEDYLQKVQRRLIETREVDRLEEKERVRHKHKKRRLKEKGDRADLPVETAPVFTLGYRDDADDDSGPEESFDDTFSVSHDADHDLAAQEELALSLIQGKMSK